MEQTQHWTNHPMLRPAGIPNTWPFPRTWWGSKANSLWCWVGLALHMAMLPPALQRLRRTITMVCHLGPHNHDKAAELAIEPEETIAIHKIVTSISKGAEMHLKRRQEPPRWAYNTPQGLYAYPVDQEPGYKVSTKWNPKPHGRQGTSCSRFRGSP